MNPERYSLEKAQEEAAAMQDKMADGKAANYDHAENLVEIDRKKQAEGKEKGSKGPENPEVYKAKLAMLAGGLRRLAGMALEQERQGLNTTLEPHKLNAALNGLEDMLLGPELDADALAESVQRIAAVLRETPEQKRGGRVVLNRDEIDREMFFTQDSVDLATQAIIPFREWERGHKVGAALRQVDDVLQKRWQMNVKRREALSRYLDGR